MGYLPLMLVVGLVAAAPLREEPFALDEPAEVVAEVRAACAGCDWGAKGREAAVLELRVDGRYAQHLFLTRGLEADYRVALGRWEAGAHRLTVSRDPVRSARGAGAAVVSKLTITSVAAGATDARLLAHAPVFWARPNTVGRFTDVPLVHWVETDRREGGGTRLRYSVVFSNEDGGTPADRLMATWGRLTDIEFAYGVDLDGAGRVVAEQYQGPEHRLLPFGGAHEDDHPVLYVATDNNMFSDRGQTTLRFAPAPVAFDLTDTSREAVMDAEPWTYAVSVGEARREGRVHEHARPGTKRIPDPRRFATLEACAETRDATVGFSLAVRRKDGRTRWFDSDAGLPAFRIGRRETEFPNGCFRGAVALPAGTVAGEIIALRVRAWTRIAGKDERPLPKGSGSAVLKRVNHLFLLGDGDLPGRSFFSWEGERALVPEGPPVEIAIPGATSSAVQAAPHAL
jgi:hypothetical protein